MINEKERAEEILNGVPFKKEYFFSAYLILAKYFNSIGLNALEIREKIEEWEEKYGHKHYFDLNKMIMSVVSKNQKICSDFKVRINKADIDIIKKRFDNKNVQKIALALLCYAKYNKSKEIMISLPSLAQFTNISYSTLKQKYINELVSFDYIKKIPPKKNKWGWDDDNIQQDYKQMKLSILVDFVNQGEYVLDNNDISSFFEKVFN